MSDIKQLNNLNYSDICWLPSLGLLSSRDLADTSIKLGEWKFRCPVVPSNMEDCISYDLADMLSEHGYFYILHRFYPKKDILEWIKKAQGSSHPISISIGVSELDKKFLQEIVEHEYRIDFLTIDIAHGYSLLMKEMVEYIDFLYRKTKRPFVIAGNVAGNDSSILFLDMLNINAIKVGLAFGKACRTYNETGVGSPMFSAGLTARTNTKKILIGDGGVRERGDIVKGLIAGYDMIMCGSLFAACINSPSLLLEGNKKEYHGSASSVTKQNVGKPKKYIEGTSIEIPCNHLTYLEMFDKINESIRSGISYAGGKTLDIFQNFPYHRVIALNSAKN